MAVTPGAAVLGFVGALVTVGAWSRTGPATLATDPSSWFGLTGGRHQSDARLVLAEVLLALGLTALGAGWWWLQRLAARGVAGLRATTTAWLLWMAPFALGPPLGSRDVWAYAAQGELARRGLDPGLVPVSRLGPSPLLAAVDPRWRETKPPYGGLGVLLEHGAAVLGGGRPLASVVVLRALAVLAVVVLVLGSARLARPDERARVVILVGGCPPLLIHLVSGAHLDAVAAALLVLALLLAGVRADRPPVPPGWRHWAAVALCGLAATAKLFVLVAALWLTAAGIAALLRTSNIRRWRVVGAVLAADAVALAAGMVLASVAAGTGAGWLANLATPGRLRTHLAPVDLAALVLGPLLPLDSSQALALMRGMGSAVAVALAAWLVVRHPGSLSRLAGAVTAVAVLGPVFYPWYLAPVVPLCAVAGERLRRALLIGGLALSVVTLPTLTPAVRLARVHPLGSALLGIVVVLLLTGAAGQLVRRGQTSRRTRKNAATASTTAA